MSPALELRILGRFEARIGGAVLEVAPMPERLLAVLTLRAGEALTAASLIESMWDGEAPASASSVLRVYVAQLRRALPAGRLLSDRAGYLLAVAEGELDAERFEHLLADGRHALADAKDRLAESPSRVPSIFRDDALLD